MKVALQCRRQGGHVLGLERCRIGSQAPVIHAGQLLHLLWNAGIAYAEFADRMIDVLEESIDDLLGDFWPGLAEARVRRK